MTRTKWLWVAVICLSLAFAGCDGKKSSTRSDSSDGRGVTVQQGSPKEVLETAIRSAEKLETDAVLQITPPEYQEGIKAGASGVGKMKQLPAKFSDLADAAAAKSFGKETVDQLRIQAKGLEEMMKKGAIHNFAEVYDNGKINWDKVKFDEKSDTATATWPGQEKPAKFKKISGKWFKIPDEGTPEEFNRKSKANSAVFDKTLSKLEEIITQVQSGTMNEDQLGTALEGWSKIMDEIQK